MPYLAQWIGRLPVSAVVQGVSVDQDTRTEDSNITLDLTKVLRGTHPSISRSCGPSDLGGVGVGVQEESR